MSIASSRLAAVERERRSRAVAEAEHSSAMDGVASSPEFRSDAVAYIEGRFDADELVRRTRARHGLD